MFQLEQRGAMNAQAELDPAAVAVAVGADADAGASAGAERDDGSGGRPCPVFISADGTVAVNGEIIASAASGDAAQTAVLDHLQQRALALATPVEASVLDQQRRIVLRIRVREDGASELLEDPLPLDVADPSPVPSPAPAHPSPTAAPTYPGPTASPVTPTPPPVSAPPAAPAPSAVPSAPEVPGSGAAPGPGAGAGAGAGSRSGPYRDYDTAILTALRTPTHGPPAQAVQAPKPSPHPSPGPVAVPEELVAGVTLVCETVTSGELALARVQASALERQAAHRFGPEHLYTLEARALEAYVAHLTGDHAAATTLALQVAELRHRQGDLRAREDIERAVAFWESLSSPYTAVPLGRRLLPLWNRISGADGTERYAAAGRRLSLLAQVTPPAFAAALRNIC
ncbi:hypothetical protein [Streptomyces sp. NBC_00103]|uniref:hypothetical protein n=1 Tax=Streptomyces sp. NBC_00103 TaxID=2975653 RepID=UPI002251D1A9|nr:hypothetical protein [Streptomyces sp. NBC_00103]MCX5372140.1 hypothetical protein [Streptomyces sp. NBC_00103]